ncbi:MAG: MEDS domain-containing protein [Alphaproteobacteria bacterium]|uniref:Oxygen sensor histidine kinase NreB n=1 Tax=Candidatus Nitrobium versatile TaxID=2884831 RepID=A0A953J9E3_9BACT|nr:MEDS domain-containing protein [Candidatus Nitrobium versatile]
MKKSTAREKTAETGIGQVGRVPWGTHLCQFYRTKKDIEEIFVPFFARGLRDNEFCVCVVSAPLRREEIIDLLRESLGDLDDRLAGGQVELFSPSDVYLRNDTFGTGPLAFWNDRLEHALERGYDGMRVAANVSWCREADWQKLVGYEEEFDLRFERKRLLALCAYPLQELSPAETLDVFRAHQITLVRREETWEALCTVRQRQPGNGRLSYHNRLRSMASDLFLAEERERRRLAMDLHDSVAQILALSRAKLKMLGDVLSSTVYERPLDEVTGMIEQTLDYIRTLTFDLSPPDLYELGLSPALKSLCEQFYEKHGLRVFFAHGDVHQTPDHETGALLYRIIKELLYNAVKHAQAGTVKVSLSADAHGTRITVTDDGKGFIPPSSSRGETGFGLFSIRERLLHIGGKLEIKSRPGFGTRITISVPPHASGITRPDAPGIP